jgi:hypothetical protein
MLFFCPVAFVPYITFATNCMNAGVTSNKGTFQLALFISQSHTIIRFSKFYYIGLSAIY